MEQVTWSDFATCICQNLGLKGPKDSNETLLSNLKNLLGVLYTLLVTKKINSPFSNSATGHYGRSKRGSNYGAVG